MFGDLYRQEKLRAFAEEELSRRGCLLADDIADPPANVLSTARRHGMVARFGSALAGLGSRVRASAHASLSPDGDGLRARRNSLS
jgi:hypothetical protein